MYVKIERVIKLNGSKLLKINNIYLLESGGEVGIYSNLLVRISLFFYAKSIPYMQKGRMLVIY